MGKPQQYGQIRFKPKKTPAPKEGGIVTTNPEFFLKGKYILDPNTGVVRKVG